ncbi:cobalamin biosynthesis protein CbiX (plasmid) [Candidatus Symbiopectobacterium sp. 'North America']|uniref:cobalamin biosynthesis protein CbiX n=1 Tax=Candidatus Symbiopectobacterium sp. 'North America' TaxID=2794574 RepID=UPI0018C9B5E0|nr:cobalamin biosynthesis protein CbiX [Candidatus Symbiopectobacterium sp. 'North America']MBG6246678.1 cobalamin biosynthesis protein CbiX [Candidatus Symbiopectobacterium sp. 'North America']
MHFTTFLSKCFDIEVETEFDSSSERNLTHIWLYEKGEDVEPILILHEIYNSPKAWCIGNVYSNLEHGAQIQEVKFRQLVKSGNVHNKGDKDNQH